MRVEILLVVTLSTALELGCAARGQQVAMHKSPAGAPSTNSTSARDPFKKLRESLNAAKRKGPPPPLQGVDRSVDVYAEARPESPAAVGTRGDGLSPLPTAAAPAPQTPVPGDKTGAYASRPESTSARNLLIRNLLIIAIVATGLLLAFGILSRRPSR